MDYLPIRSITVCGKKVTTCISSVCTALKRSDNDETSQTCLRAMRKMSFHLAVCRLEQGFVQSRNPICTHKQTHKQAIAGVVLWFGVEKWMTKRHPDHCLSFYFLVMQDNFNALYRRRLVTSCHTITPLFLHIKK